MTTRGHHRRRSKRKRKGTKKGRVGLEKALRSDPDEVEEELAPAGR
jgi:hypothetical protein